MAVDGEKASAARRILEKHGFRSPSESQAQRRDPIDSGKVENILKRHRAKRSYRSKIGWPREVWVHSKLDLSPNEGGM